MRLTGSRAYYRSTPPKMPTGLVELIEGLTREVLKNNPSDIYGFCAGHVQQLLEIRDGPLQKKTLTLEEKIAKAQAKVRLRAEQRRRQYNNDLLNQQSVKRPEIEVNPINKDERKNTPSFLPQAVQPIMSTKSEQDLNNSSEVESSPELCKPNEEVKDLSVQNDDDLKYDIKSEPMDTKCESKSNTSLAELSNETSDSIIYQDATLNESPKTGTPATKVEKLDHFCAPIAERQITQAGPQSLKEDQELVADAGALYELAEVTVNTEQHFSSPMKTLIPNQNSGVVDADEKDSTVLSQLENTVDLVYHNSVTQDVTVISNDINEAQSDNIILLLNKEENHNSNHTDSIQNIIDPDIINQSYIDNVELTTNFDDTVNKNEEDPQDTNTFDISFKESATVELNDPQINSDMLDSLLETNTDSDIVTLLTQDSTNAEFNPSLVDLQQNGFKHTPVNAELPVVYKDNSGTNGIVSAREELQESNQHKNAINDIDLIANNNKENYAIYKNGDENTSTKLSETPQIHNQEGNMDLETAAVTIQKVFRTFLFKSRASTFDDTVNEEILFLNEAENNKKESDFTIAGSLNERRSHGLTRMDTVLQTVNEEKSLSLSTDDSSTISSAATVIQAHVRGFLARSKLNSNKTVSTNSLAATNSNVPSLTSLEMDNEQNKNKTVLNIHIVPEGGNYLSRDESLITSMDLSLDSSPPSSINLHPLGYDRSERRKQLKREDAIQSISPPSNNSGKLSEDVDSVKELPLNDVEITEEHEAESNVVKDDLNEGTSVEVGKNETHAENIALRTIVSDNAEKLLKQKESVEKTNSDEMDVVTPFISTEDNNSSNLNLMHSGEFHDAVLPTKVSRSDTTVASEFKNVLVYFLLWNHS